MFLKEKHFSRYFRWKVINPKMLEIDQLVIYPDSEKFAN